MGKSIQILIIFAAFVGGTILAGSFASAAPGEQGKPFEFLQEQITSILDGTSPVGVASDLDCESCVDESEVSFTNLDSLSCADGQIAKTASGTWVCASDLGGGSIVLAGVRTHHVTSYDDDGSRDVFCPPGKVMTGVGFDADDTAGLINRIRMNAICSPISIGP